ncbi:hypothetical protein [Alicyclobacillus fastidiosus]|uniref:hypothetical protein n=1 Tax=Alicyclobacillus fastidiosus TaxID=392011 RepID=UPI0034D75228
MTTMWITGGTVVLQDRAVQADVEIVDGMIRTIQVGEERQLGVEWTRHTSMQRGCSFSRA